MYKTVSGHIDIKISFHGHEKLSLLVQLPTRISELIMCGVYMFLLIDLNTMKPPYHDNDIQSFSQVIGNGSHTYMRGSVCRCW